MLCAVSTFTWHRLAIQLRFYPFYAAQDRLVVLLLFCEDGNVVADNGVHQVIPNRLTQAAMAAED
jgi:hypothetical protein